MFKINLHWQYHITCDPIHDSPALRELMLNPDSVLQPGCNLIKNDLKTTIGTAMIDGKRIVVKRYNIVDRWHALKRYLSQSRASVCWQAAHLLQTIGILTPQPIAMIERRLGFLKSTSYYIHEFSAGMDAGEYFTAEQKAGSWPIVAKEIAQLIEQLRKANISHGDLKVNNILIADQKPILIDLDDTRQHFFKFSAKAVINKDIQRFMAYWKNNSKISDLFRVAFGIMNK